MIETKSYRFSPEGGILAEKARIKEGELQLQILLNSMKFQNLKQGRRELRYADGTVFNITSCFGIHTVNIYVPSTEIFISEEEKPEERNPLYLLYMGDPIVLKNADGEILEGLTSEVDTDRFYREYDVKKDLEIDGHITSNRNMNLAVNNVCAVPIWVAGLDEAGSSKSGHGMYSCYRHDSITYDDWTAHAVAWVTQNPGGEAKYYWAVCVDYLGAFKRFTNPFYNPDNLLDEEFLATWPGGDNLFQDKGLPCGLTEYYGTYTSAHGFDLWRLEADIGEKEWEEGDYCLSICGDKNTLHVWNLTQDKYWPKPINIIGQVATDYPADCGISQAWDPDIHTYLLGCNKFNVFYFFGQMLNGNVENFYEIYTVDTLINEIVRHNEDGHEIAYNPFLGEIWHVNHGSIRVISVLETPKIYLYNIHDPSLPDSCRLHTIYAGLGGGSGPGFSTGYHRKSNEGGGISNTDWWMTERKVGPILYNFGKGYIGYFDGEKISGTISHRTLQTAIKDAMGCSDYDHWGFRLTGGPGIGYTNWAETVGDLLGISVTKDGTGSKRLVTFLNGVNRASAEIIESEEILSFGSYDPDYSNSVWPYINQFAILKHAFGTAKKEFEDIVLQKDIYGIVRHAQEIMGENEDIFFVVTTDYNIIPTTI